MGRSITIGSPLCFDEIYVSDDDGSAFLESKVFNPNMHLHRRRVTGPHIIFGDEGVPSAYHIAQACVSNTSKPCSGLQNTIRNLLLELMAYTVRREAEVGDKHGAFGQRRSSVQSFCQTSDGKVKCGPAMCCFMYGRFDGREPLLGCIEDIPRFHGEDPELRDVLDCRSMLWSNDANICHAIVDASQFNGTAGLLSC